MKLSGSHTINAPLINHGLKTLAQRAERQD